MKASRSARIRTVILKYCTSERLYLLSRKVICGLHVSTIILYYIILYYIILYYIILYYIILYYISYITLCNNKYSLADVQFFSITTRNINADLCTSK